MSKKITSEKFIARAKQIHGEKYDYSQSIYTKCEDKIKITCNIHGPFYQRPISHMKGSGCSKCGTKSIMLHDFIEKANKIHNNYYDYSKTIYNKHKENVIIVCPEHGEFKQTPISHLLGYGCHKYAGKRNLNSEFIEKSKNKFGNKFDYSLVKFGGIYTKVKLICDIHGEFEITPKCHLHAKTGCTHCGKIKQKEVISITKEEFINISEAIHKKLYSYKSAEYKNTTTKVEITCSKHGSFWQKPSAHMSGHGCKKCNSRTISKIERKWLDSLNVPDDKVHRQVRFILDGNVYFVDGFDPQTNTIYELYGDLWHGNPKIYNQDRYCTATKKTFGEMYNNTLEREIAFKNAGYKLIIIWENEFRKLYGKRKIYATI